MKRRRGATNSNTSEFTQLRTFDRCEITAEGKLDYQLDGDYAGTILPGEIATIHRLPAKLRVCVPRSFIPGTPLEKFLAHPMVEAWRTLIRHAREF